MLFYCKMAYELWSVYTNLVGILPAYVFFKQKQFVDAIYISLTFVASILYHLTFDVEEFSNEPINPKAIQNTDFILSDMLLLMLPSWIIWRSNYKVRFPIYVSMVPVQTYALWDSNVYRYYLYYAYTVPMMMYILYKYWKSIYFIIGMLLSITECVIYFELANRHDKYHHLYHGFHHVCAFLSICFYQRIPEIKKRTYSNEQTGQNIQS